MFNDIFVAMRALLLLVLFGLGFSAVGVETDSVYTITWFGAPSVYQNGQTSYGDNDNPDPGLSTGSELNFGDARIANGKLHIFLGGNMETNYNKLEIFVDVREGGQNRMLGNNADVSFGGLNRLGDDGTGNGLTFDVGFEPDMWIGVTCGVADGVVEFYVNYAELHTEGGGYGAYIGSGTPGPDGALISLKGMEVALSNANIDGVAGGQEIDCGVSGESLEGETGLEIAIPLYLFDWDGEGIQIESASLCAMINSSNHDYLSNQVLGGIFGGPSLGDPRNVDFNAFPGNQSFAADATAAPCPTVLGTCCVTSGEEVSCQTVPASVCSFYGGEYGGDGTDCVNDDNCVPPVQCASDINDDGRVDVGDLLQVIGDWGCIE